MLSSISSNVLATTDSPTQQEMDAWLKDDSESRIDKVNEGQLRLLPPQDRDVLHSINRIVITQKSIDTGWIGVEQCYRHLDAVAEAQVVYQYKFLRDLKIIKHSGIAKAWIEGQSVQLQQVSKGAELCVQAEARAFYQNEDGSFTLASGPYQRRFLDGYYPMQVSLNVSYPRQRLRFLSVEPAKLSASIKEPHAEELRINSVFEGKLTMKVHFTARP